MVVFKKNFQRFSLNQNNRWIKYNPQFLFAQNLFNLYKYQNKNLILNKM